MGLAEFSSSSEFCLSAANDLKISANSKTPLPFADFPLEFFLRKELLPWCSREWMSVLKSHSVYYLQ